MIILNLSKLPNAKKLLKADFYNISSFQQQIDMSKPDQEVSGKPAELVTNVLKELQQKKEPAMLHFAMPDVPKRVLFLLRRAIINHNETLPQVDTMVVKVWKDPNRKSHVCAMWYPSEQAVPQDVGTLAGQSGSPTPAPQGWMGGGAFGGQGGPPTLAALETLKFLNDGPRFPVKLQFEDGISQQVKDLFTTVIDIYNKALEPKTKNP